MKFCAACGEPLSEKEANDNHKCKICIEKISFYSRNYNYNNIDDEDDDEDW